MLDYNHKFDALRIEKCVDIFNGRLYEYRPASVLLYNFVLNRFYSIVNNIIICVLFTKQNIELTLKLCGIKNDDNGSDSHSWSKPFLNNNI